MTRRVADTILRSFAIKDAMCQPLVGEPRLGICSACQCPLNLKVWVDIKHIDKHTDEETLAKLHKDCWILKELPQ